MVSLTLSKAKSDRFPAFRCSAQLLGRYISRKTRLRDIGKFHFIQFVVSAGPQKGTRLAGSLCSIAKGRTRDPRVYRQGSKRYRKLEQEK